MGPLWNGLYTVTGALCGGGLSRLSVAMLGAVLSFLAGWQVSRCTERCVHSTVPENLAHPEACVDVQCAVL